jgi:phosphoglycerate dehydrogenase-like enzyme
MVDDVSLLVVEVEKVTSRVLEAAQDLELIAVCRGTPSNVDLDRATSRGIPVLHTPGRNAESVADFAIGLMLAAGREICRADRHLRRSGWHVDDEIPYLHFRGPEIVDKHLALLGCGDIGQAIARRARGLRMNVLAHDPYVSQAEVDGLVELVSFDELLAHADFLSLHVPVTEETRGMIGWDEISRMKPGAYLINTARADVVVEDALYQALKQERIAGAALDVFWEEPLPADSPWLEVDNVTLTPHIAGAAYGVRVHHTGMIIEDVRAFVDGRRPARVANPEVYSEN